jgi:hypothetical protein
LRISVLKCLQVLGDSLMRQLFSRLVHMMRGHARVVDYKMHTHASYSVCQVPLPCNLAAHIGSSGWMADFSLMWLHVWADVAVAACSTIQTRSHHSKCVS